VLGGDCTLLLGVGVALQRRFHRPGLWFVDGHTDTFDAATSPTGEAADMELGALTGHGPLELTASADADPVIAPERVIVLGHRHADDLEDARELDLVDPAIERVDARAVRAQGPRAAATGAEPPMGCQRTSVKKASISAANSAGCSQAAKWPPRSGSLQ
jgi:arginase